jgi:hypothetical protein
MLCRKEGEHRNRRFYIYPQALTPAAISRSQKIFLRARTSHIFLTVITNLDWYHVLERCKRTYRPQCRVLEDAPARHMESVVVVLEKENTPVSLAFPFGWVHF